MASSSLRPSTRLGAPRASRERGDYLPFPSYPIVEARELNPGPKTVSTTDLHVCRSF